MTSTNPQSLNQNADRPRSTVGDASQQSSRRPSQPRFVLQPVVLDDTAPSDVSDQRIAPAASDADIERQAINAETRQYTLTPTLDELTVSRDADTRNGSQERTDQTRVAPPERRASLPDRLAIIGALVVCGVIAIALFVTLLLTGMPPVA